MNAQLKPEPWPQDAGPDTRSGEISAALAKAQAEMQNPGFDSTNPHYKNKFASLAAVRNAVVPVFAKHGIAMSQDLRSTEGAVSCTTILMHGSGQRLSFGPLILPVSKNDAQGFGSAATYARRYSLMAVAGVVGDDDDDANSAIGNPAAAVGHRPQGDMGKNVPPAKVQETVKRMLDLMGQDIPGDHEDHKKAMIVLDYHEKVLNPDEDLYVAVGDALPAAKRNVWKVLVNLAKKLEKDDAASDPSRGRKF